MKAVLRNHRQSPRKVALVASMIRGKSVNSALHILKTVTKRSALPIEKLLNSAVANAVNNDKAEKDRLFISEIQVNQGPTLKRSMPRARGSAFPIKKRTSHISVILSSK